MSSLYKKIEELYFVMKEYYKFEEILFSNIKNISTCSDTVILVDYDDIENWKKSVLYEDSLKFLELDDSIGFYNFQINNVKPNDNFSTSIKNTYELNVYESMDEVCYCLLKKKKFAIISQYFYSYIKNVTYPPKVFRYYSKNNQLIIYFGEGNSLFITKYFSSLYPEIKHKYVYVVDLPEEKSKFIENIFKPNNLYNTIQNGIGIYDKMTKLLDYNINMNLVKTYNPSNKMNNNDDYRFNNYYYSQSNNGFLNEKDNDDNYYFEGKVEYNDKNNNGGNIIAKEEYIIIKDNGNNTTNERGNNLTIEEKKVEIVENKEDKKDKDCKEDEKKVDEPISC